MINESEVLNLYERHCDGIKSQGSSQYVALCPFHDETVHSFSFNTETSLYYCHSCTCLLYTSPSPRDRTRSRMPSSA